MSDVFISYARSTEEQAKRIEEALRGVGYAVWRDNELPAHRTYAEVIEERLSSAKAVVVLWSSEATRSQWVRAEADAARELGTLVQASIDGTVPPLPFNQIHCADLKEWRGDKESDGWRKLHASVAALTGRSEESAQPAKSRREKVSICVLPFANMSGDAEQEYFNDGISEDITTDLSKISALAVTARNTAFTFKGTPVDVPTIARKLAVSHVLEGSVRKAENRVRITAQLINGETGDHVWAERWDRDLTDIFAIQDEIAKEIVSALKLKLLPEEKKAIEQRGTSDAEAYNLYLMARQYWVTGNHGDRTREERVVRICKRAVEIDPNFARAWALMAIAQSNLRFGFSEPVDDGVAAAMRALELDPSIPETYCVTSRRLFEDGKVDEALAEMGRGLRLDPDSWELNKASAGLSIRLGQIERATRHFERAVATVEVDYHGWGMLVSCYSGIGDNKRAKEAARKTVEQTERVLAQDPSNGAAISFLVAGLAALGEEERARDWMNRALLIDPDNLNMRYNFGCALAAQFGDRESAIEMLGPVLARTKTIGNMEFDPDLKSVRDDPRFQCMFTQAKARIEKIQTGSSSEA